MVIDAPQLAAGLWARIRPHVDAQHESARIAQQGLSDRFRVYRYEAGLEEKDKRRRRGEGRGRKFNNRVRFALRPAIGSVVVFDHLLLHEGSEVTARTVHALFPVRSCAVDPPA